MKTILLCIITSVFLISCSTNADFETAENLLSTAEQTAVENQYPANRANPFDLKGKKLYEALDIYCKKYDPVNSVSELTAQIRFVSENIFQSGSTTGRLIPFTDEMVEAIMDDPDNSMIVIVQNSVLQHYAKNKLISFLQQLIINRQQEFSITNNYITGYEADVLDDAVLNTEETETILTVASISRYSLYSEEDRKDKDWDILIGSKNAKPFFEINEVSLISIIALLDRLI
ncbi:hypothetical protein [Flavobacterium sp. ACN6]|uniref:hypothetical protein n=1 Tax=Flavobacterium sp. ACN6 TaxID=1920426 RepID=UPI000BB39010|nr:hypothetical protein [Flavobacterium sp. ACN6]PBJ08040.1 hypothetical protein BSF42_37570 [Flavobacterium sp. ACN6]